MPRNRVSADLPLADELAGLVARMSGLLLGEKTVDTALRIVAELAKESVDGAIGAGVTTVDARGRRTTSAATDAIVAKADLRQYELDEGPCLEAVASRQALTVVDTGDEQRWPRWAAAARQLDLRSAVSAPLVVGASSVGAMKVYSDVPGAFDARAEHLLRLFAGQAAVLVANVQTAERANRLSEGMRSAFRSRDLVSMAKGVLMGREGVNEDVAFRMLLTRAQERGCTVRDAAKSVVATSQRRRR